MATNIPNFNRHFFKMNYLNNHCCHPLTSWVRAVGMLAPPPSVETLVKLRLKYFVALKFATPTFCYLLKNCRGLPGYQVPHQTRSLLEVTSRGLLSRQTCAWLLRRRIRNPEIPGSYLDQSDSLPRA